MNVLFLFMATLKKLYINVYSLLRWVLFLFMSFRNADKIRRRQLKEGHHADVMTSPVDSVCSQINQIGQHGHQV